MQKKEKNILETLKLNEEDFQQMSNILKSSEQGVDLSKKAEKIELLKVNKKEYHFSTFLVQMLNIGMADVVEKFFISNPKISSEVVSTPESVKDSLLVVSGFLQGANTDNTLMKVVAMMVAISILIACPGIPLSVTVETMVKTIKLNKFSYSDILSGTNVFFEILDPTVVGVKIH